jgi:hypothetical protein
MTTTIRNLHAIGAADDPLAIRLRLERALGAADLHVPGMPPAAILCVRHLPDPLPGRLDLDALMPARAWEQAMRGALGRMVQRASSPALGAPPPNAPAVWFEDRAELLTCLARDWCAGALAEHWWWRALLPDRTAAGDMPSRLYAAWRATPEAIPAALALLHERGAAARFLALLPPAEILALTRNVAATFGLPALERTGGATPGDQRRKVSPAATTALIQLDRAADVRALDHDRRVLYAAGVLLARAPLLARAAWPLEVARWAAAAGFNRTSSNLPPRPGTPDTALPAPPHSTPPPNASAPVSAQVRDVATNIANESEAAATPTAIQSNNNAPPTTPPESDAAAPFPAITAPEAGMAQPFALPAAAPRPAEYIQTQFGGMLFLINLALHLELYGDFTRPLDAGISLSPWALLALLRPHMLPAAAFDDPLWAMLADLAGDAPEAHFTPRQWRVPRAWLAPFGPHRTQNAERRAQSAVPKRFLGSSSAFVGVHPRPIHSSSIAHRPSSIVHRPSFIVQRPASIAHRPSSIAHRPLRSNRAWVALFAGYARARLALALGGADAVERALALPARIYPGAVRLDIMFSLNELPIAVRLAGLDRDPGWVPAAGRDIRFHFE